MESAALVPTSSAEFGVGIPFVSGSLRLKQAPTNAKTENKARVNVLFQAKRREA